MGGIVVEKDYTPFFIDEKERNQGKGVKIRKSE